MSRRRSANTGPQTDLFPFLSVLISCMGAMIAFLFGIIFAAEENKTREEKNLEGRHATEALKLQQYEEWIKYAKDYQHDPGRIVRVKQELKQELDLSRRMSHQSVAQLRETRRKELDRAKRLDSDRTAEEKRLSKLHEENAGLDGKLALSYEEVSALKSILDMSTTIINDEKRKKNAREQMALLKFQVEDLEKKNKSLEDEKKASQAHLSEQKQSSVELQRKIKELRRKVAELKKKTDTMRLALPASLSGDERIPGVGEPVLTDYNLVYMLCRSDGVFIYTPGGKLQPVDIADTLSVQELKEELASTPDLLLEFLLRPGGEANFKAAQRVFRGLRTSKFPLSKDWDLSLAPGSEDG